MERSSRAVRHLAAGFLSRAAVHCTSRWTYSPDAANPLVSYYYVTSAKFLVAGLLVTLGLVGILVDVAEIGSWNAWFGKHQFASAMLAEGILLVGTYLILDELVEKREASRWRVISARPLAELSAGHQKFLPVVEGGITSAAN